MLRMDPVHAWDNDPRVTDAEPGCTAKHWNLFYARTSVGCRYSHRNRPRGLLHTWMEFWSRDATTPQWNAWWLSVEPKFQLHNICLSTLNIKTISVPISFSHPDISCLIIVLIYIMIQLQRLPCVL